MVPSLRQLMAEYGATGLPFIGLVMLVTMGLRAFAEKVGMTGTLRFFRNAAMLAASPSVGLAYETAIPFVGVGVLVVMAAKALSKKDRNERHGASGPQHRTSCRRAVPWADLCDRNADGRTLCLAADRNSVCS